VYCDPPYLLGQATYNESNGWTIIDDERLLKYLTSLDNAGIKFALSNVAEHKGIVNHCLVDWCMENQFNINYLNFNYRNSNYQKKNKNLKTVEVLITNY
jgi:site-specific DNA-adenine methylase